MAVELWWWVKPLWYTGYLTLMIFGIAAGVADKLSNSDRISTILSGIAFVPWVICIISIAIWFITNLLISIWGC